MDTSFSYQSRVAACDRCGAPSQVAVTGGTFTCRFCGAHNQLDSRDEALVVPHRAPVNEMERMMRLRMQDGRPLLPPPSLIHLMPDGQLQEWKVEEAATIWNQTRQELRAARGNFEAAERLVFLTMVLAQEFQKKGDKLRQREMLEGALDVASLPRHRQILRGFLARAAVRAGDLAAAEAWLRPCDPQSDDLQMDSAWRFSRAFIDTAKGNFQAVIQVLGQGPDDIPIEDASDDVCAAFRANAWEKLGNVQQAVALLRARFAAGGGSGRQTIAAVVQMYANWNLCALSYPHAMAGHNEAAGRMAAQSASGGIHTVFVPLGFLMLLGGVAGVVVFVLGLADVIDGEAASAFGLTGIILGLTGAVFFVVGMALRKSAQKAAWLRQHGIQAPAQVQGMNPTGVSINDVPMMQYDLMVQLPDRPPYIAQAKLLGLRFAPGSKVMVRVHPQNPQEIVIEMD